MMAFGEAIRVKTRREIDAMREASRHVAEVLLELRDLTKPGVTTGELDQHARKAIRKRGRRVVVPRLRAARTAAVSRRCSASR